jgi:hypothetical protein
VREQQRGVFAHAGKAAMGAAETEELARRRGRPHHIGMQRLEQGRQIAVLESGDHGQHQILVGQFVGHDGSTFAGEMCLRLDRWKSDENAGGRPRISSQPQ